MIEKAIDVSRRLSQLTASTHTLADAKLAHEAAMTIDFLVLQINNKENQSYYNLTQHCELLTDKLAAKEQELQEALVDREQFLAELDFYKNPENLPKSIAKPLKLNYKDKLANFLSKLIWPMG